MSWKPNETKPITVLFPENDSLTGFFKPRQSDSTVQFEEIQGDFEYKGSEVHELNCSFPEGEYMIKVTNNTRNIDLHIELSVKDEEYEYIKDTNFKVSSILKRMIKRGK